MLVAAGFTILLIIAVNLAWWLFYDRTEQLLDQQLSRRLQAVAGTAAAQLSPEQIGTLIDDDFTAYTRTLDLLESARQADSLSELFVLDPGYRVLVSTAFDADSVYFLAPLNGPYIDSVFFADHPRALTTPSYRTGKLYLKTAFAPLFDPDGTVAAVLGVEANVDYFDALSDLRRNLWYSTIISVVAGLLFGLLFILTQKRLNSMQQRLVMNETHAYLGRMVAVVAHEIRNPLMIIRASAERLRKKTDSEEAGFVVEEVDRLNGLVNGYLDFARGDDRDFLDGSPEPMDLIPFIANVKKHLEDKFGPGTIEWIEPSTEKSISFQGHPGALRQVLLNLLINGAEACLEAGKPIRLGLTGATDGDRIKLEISDRGPGLSKKDLKLIGDPFYTTKQHGSGLGLFLSRKIVEQMGGSIDIDSQPDHGTTVTLNLPKRGNG